MTIEELREQKRLLEKALRTVVASNLEEFRKVTGCSVKGVDIRFMQLRTLDGAECWHEVTSLNVEVETGL